MKDRYIPVSNDHREGAKWRARYTHSGVDMEFDFGGANGRPGHEAISMRPAERPTQPPAIEIFESQPAPSQGK